MKPGARGRTFWAPPALLLAAASPLLGCAEPSDELAEISAPVIYGADDRREYYELAGTPAGATLAQSMAAFIPAAPNAAGATALVAGAPSYGAAARLCPGEPFAEQPAAAFCAGVLLDWDLILTAGHCVRLHALEDFKVVFGYYYTGQGQLAFDAADTFRPVEVVAEALDPKGSDPRLDYAWIRLDRPVTAPRRPARVFTTPPVLSMDQPITSIGTPGGVPGKIDAGGRVRALRQSSSDYFVADTDTFAGSSGGGAFDHDMALLGVLARGASDLVPRADGACNLVFRAGSDVAPQEEFTNAHRAVAGLCAQEPAASSLCRTSCGQPCEALPFAGEPPASEGCSLAGRPAPGTTGLPAVSALLALLIRPRRCPRRREKPHIASASSV